MEQLDLFKAYFTEEGNYYAEKLEKFNNGKKHSFNIWSALFGITWFFYRKMYTEGIIILVVTFLLGIISAILFSLFNPYDIPNAQNGTYLIWVMSFIILGFIGNSLYLRKANRIVNEYIYKNQIETIENKHLNEMRIKGGTSIVSALICVVILIVIQIISKLNS